MAIQLDDPLAHRALDALMAAENRVIKGLRAEIESHGISPTGFAVLVLLTSASGSLEMRTVRLRIRASKANVTEVVNTLESRGLLRRSRIPENRRAAMLTLTDRGRAIVEETFPRHTVKVRDVFAPLDETEKRALTTICRKLAA